MPQLHNGVTPFGQLPAILSPLGLIRVCSLCESYEAPRTLLQEAWRAFPSGPSKASPPGYNIIRALNDSSMHHVFGPVSALEASSVLFPYDCSGSPRGVHLACLTSGIIGPIHTTPAGQVPFELMDCMIGTTYHIDSESLRD